MSLMCNPLPCGTVLCCRISMASRTLLVCQCGMDVMRLLSSQLILCCCACFTMADLSSSPSRWQALCSFRTQVLVLSENQNVGSIPGSNTCVLEQDTSP